MPSCRTSASSTITSMGAFAPSTIGPSLRVDEGEVVRSNHHDPVTNFHLAADDAGWHRKARTASRTCPRFQGDTVTSPATADAADLPDYAPIPRSALGPALNEQGYH